MFWVKAKRFTIDKENLANDPGSDSYTFPSKLYLVSMLESVISMYMNRKLAAEVGNETLEVMESGGYVLEDGTHVSIEETLAHAVSETVEYPPHKDVVWAETGQNSTVFEVTNETTLNAVTRLVEQGYHVGALNFASAKNPGGGFLGGSRAQEESLARSSGLYNCIKDCDMYTYHRSMKSCLYSDYVIVSPHVPVFRHDDGSLLTQPYLCTFLTSPAVNAGVVRKRREATAAKIKEVMWKRTEKVLTLAAQFECEALVLGAWGCGVFRNDVATIAELFEDHLLGIFQGVFKHITFAILDSSKQERFIGPFKKTFGHCKQPS